MICLINFVTHASRHLDLNVALGINNNGFSLIPAFSLGKPSAIAAVSVSDGKRFSFDPEFRYSLKGKPWSFIFIWRYKLIKKERFHLTLGTHLPALNFVSDSVVRNGVEEEATRARRFFPVIEFNPGYLVSKDITMGFFYQYGGGVEKELPRHSHFLSVRANFSNVRLPKQLSLKFNPQLYYLTLDDKKGWYAASGLTLAMRSFPLSISTLMNKATQTNIAGKEFDWNIGLVYSFNESYTR